MPAQTTEPTTMQAGRELDALIARRVMGWTDFVQRTATCAPEFDVTATPPRWDAIRYQRVPEFSTDVAAAWEVVEAMHRRGLRLTLTERELFGGWRACFMGGPSNVSPSRLGDTAPLAICRAALSALSHATPSPTPEAPADAR